MMIPKSRKTKIKEILLKSLKALGKRAFLSFLGLLFLSLIFGGVLFYKYNISVKNGKVDFIIIHSKFKEDAFQNILRAREEREKKFRETEFKEYPNPFQKPIPALSSTSSAAASTQESPR